MYDNSATPVKDSHGRERRWVDAGEIPHGFGIDLPEASHGHDRDVQVAGETSRVSTLV